MAGAGKIGAQALSFDEGGFLCIPDSPDLNFGANGLLDEFRIVKGSAEYTANFTPPAQPYTW